MTRPSILILGAGAAGIGAGMALAAKGVSFEILEAKDRVGGRAFTDAASLPSPWDHGCAWLHCADENPLVAEAERVGAEILRQERIDHFLIHKDGRFLSDAEADGARRALSHAFEAIEAEAARGEDGPVASLLDAASPFQAETRSILSIISADEPERLSLAGEADYRDTGVNWLPLGGYGALMARLAAPLPIRLSTPVRRVAQTAEGVAVDTDVGRLTADAVLVTASTGVLLDGAVEIGPGPAREALTLMSAAPLGAYEKIAVALRRNPVEDPRKIFCWISTPDQPPSDVQIQPGEPTLMIFHIGGDAARRIAALPADARGRWAVDRLAHAFGEALREEVIGTATTDWGADPFIRGAYSHVVPGRAQDRRDLIGLETGRIAFAGEALSLRAQGTCHGAWLSGQAVAARLAEAVRPA
ncbi:MAG: NAD(P)/FAD-dependent oxidoreductase [Pseudomonadota bacterium]